jgi:hypothetical protein
MILVRKEWTKIAFQLQKHPGQWNETGEQLVQESYQIGFEIEWKKKDEEIKRMRQKRIALKNRKDEMRNDRIFYKKYDGMGLTKRIVLLMTKSGWCLFMHFRLTWKRFCIWEHYRIPLPLEDFVVNLEETYDIYRLFLICPSVRFHFDIFWHFHLTFVSSVIESRHALQLLNMFNWVILCFRNFVQHDIRTTACEDTITHVNRR